MNEKLEQTLAKLRAEYARDLAGTVAQMEDLWRRLATGELPPSQLTELVRMAHSISGSAETLGLPRASAAARELESFLDPFSEDGRLPGAAEQVSVLALLAALRQTAAPI